MVKFIVLRYPIERLTNNAKNVGVCTCRSSHPSKALALPITVERATQKPTHDMITYHVTATITGDPLHTIVSNPTMVIYRCLILDCD
ncbi:MAG: hypothetical protein IJP59_11830 [Muribaculaceae bacterium]|nr:hypothetical protein [Muribaculaceae bacterium]